jgi:ABC-type branched-subunit amino acid transport system substrate-binding protein
MRVVQPDDLQAAAISTVIGEVGWTKIACIYTDNAYGNGLYSSFVSNLAGISATIENAESKRAIEAPDNE